MREKELRAIFYARVSTEEEEQLNAIEKQIEEKKKLIELERYLIDLVKTEENISKNKMNKKQMRWDKKKRLASTVCGGGRFLCAGPWTKRFGA